MRVMIKNFLMSCLLGSLTLFGSALGAWSYDSSTSYHSWVWRHHHHHDHPDYHHYSHEDGLATGLILGGLLGLVAGGAMANHSQSTQVYHYYGPTRCQKEGVDSWTECNAFGECQRVTQWYDPCH